MTQYLIVAPAKNYPNFHKAVEKNRTNLATKVGMDVEIQWVESLNQDQFNKIEVFFNNLPKLKETIKMTCGKCGFNHTIEVEGLESFFG